MLLKPEGKRSRPRLRWMDGVERDLRNLGVVNWKTKAQERDGRRMFLEHAKTHKGLIIILSLVDLELYVNASC
jgi:hypothetical protein